MWADNRKRCYDPTRAAAPGNFVGGGAGAEQTDSCVPLSQEAKLQPQDRLVVVGTRALVFEPISKNGMPGRFVGLAEEDSNNKGSYDK